MSNHPTIIALKAALESERDTIVDKWKNSNGYYSEDRYIASGFNMRDMRSISSFSHEVATERLMAIIEKMLGVIEKYEPYCVPMWVESEIPEFKTIKEVWLAREFLSTIADAGVIKKDGE